MRIFRTLAKVLAGLVLFVVLVFAGLVLELRTRLPASTFDLQPAAAAARGPVLIFGASGAAGYEITKLLRARGQAVTAVVRPTSDRSRLEPLGVTFTVADAFDPAAVRAAASSGSYQAVISLVSCMPCDPPPDFTGNRNIVDAAKAAGIGRMILISTIGAGDSYDAANLLSKIVLRKVLPLKTQAEDYLKQSGLGYTIIRPGGLRGKTTTPTGLGYLTEDRSVLGFIHRADLARLIVGALDDERTVNKTFAALDPSINRPWQ